MMPHYADPFLQAWEDLLHYTMITLGSPPQSFRALVDISFPSLFVTSSQCHSWSDYGVCNGAHFQYNPSWSTTSRSSYHFAFGHHLVIEYVAQLSTDTFSVGGIEIQNQGFHLGLDVYQDPFMAYPWDGILGLASDDLNSPPGVKGPLTNIVEQGHLDTGILSIMLGRWDNVIGLVPGEIVFGGVNEEMLKENSSIRFLPMANKTDSPRDHWRPPFYNGTWQVIAQRVSFSWFNKTSQQNETVSYEMPANGSARFDTARPQILLPDSVAQALAAIAQPTLHPGMPPTIPCNAISQLPDLIFVLGGEEFVLKPTDYVLQGMGLIDKFDCMYVISSGKGVIPSDLIVLGSPFTRGFYLVLDRKKRVVGLGEPSWRDKIG
jgi:hypothetical protein